MISDMCNAAGCVCVCVFQCTVVNETVCMCDFCLRAYFRYFSLQGIQMAGNHSTFSLISLSLSHQRQILSSLAHLSISQTSSSIICVNVFFFLLRVYVCACLRLASFVFSIVLLYFCCCCCFYWCWSTDIRFRVCIRSCSHVRVQWWMSLREDFLTHA